MKMSAMNTFAARLKKARTSAGMTQAELAELVGVDQTSISNLERGKSQGTSFVVRLARACDVNPIWLETGEGEMKGALASGAASPAISQSPGSSKTLQLVRQLLESRAAKALPLEDREKILQAAEATYQEDKAGHGNVIRADFSRSPLVGDEIRIAHYDVQGAMGSGKLVHDFPEMFRDVTVSQQHLRELGVTYKDPSHLKLITGDGQSMAPTIQDKDPLISDVSIREFTGDGIYAFTWQGLFYIKRLQVADEEHFEMISDNPTHKDRLIRIDDTYIQARILLVWNANRV